MTARVRRRRPIAEPGQRSAHAFVLKVTSCKRGPVSRRAPLVARSSVSTSFTSCLLFAVVCASSRRLCDFGERSVRGVARYQNRLSTHFSLRGSNQPIEKPKRPASARPSTFHKEQVMSKQAWSRRKPERIPSVMTLRVASVIKSSRSESQTRACRPTSWILPTMVPSSSSAWALPVRQASTRTTLRAICGSAPWPCRSIRSGLLHVRPKNISGRDPSACLVAVIVLSR
jgi:hypothetical protein